LRLPCSAGEAIVTVTPANGWPDAVTLPASEAVVCAKRLEQTIPAAIANMAQARRTGGIRELWGMSG
jgi:hypothetical protein